jgi:hypothetical protein
MYADDVAASATRPAETSGWFTPNGRFLNPPPPGFSEE